MQKNKNTQIVAGILLLFFVALFLTLTARFLYIQATGEVNDISLEEWAAKKRTASHSLHAERGKIFDKNGMSLAYDRPTFQMYAIVDPAYSKNSEDPIHVKDAESTAEELAPILDADVGDIKERLDKGKENDQFQVEFGEMGKNLSQETKEEIDDLELPGIQFNKNHIRYYPNAKLASHIIGLAERQNQQMTDVSGVKDEIDMPDSSEEDVGKGNIHYYPNAKLASLMKKLDDEDDEDDDGGNIVGTAGIENEMDDYLHGEDGHISYHHDNYGFKLLDPKEVITKPKDGNDVYLTLDQKIQMLVEDSLDHVDEAYHPERITAAVMDPESGEVLAMADRPSYNPNDPENVENWYNDVISSPFDPGSTMKIFTWAAAIDAGEYEGDEEYESGKYKAEDYMQTIHDHNDGEGWGSIPFDEGFTRSSNVGAARLVWEKLGPDKYHDYLEAFDFDQATGIDLPDEVPGQILYDRGIEQITTSFGQGTTLTPIQQLKAATSIVNDGKMVKPYVISEVKDPETDEIKEKNDSEDVGKPISKETSDKVRDLMDSVVNDDDGTGTGFQLDDYTAIGKTGTSQISSGDSSNAFLKGKENHVFSFLGMAPKDDPELLMYVSVKQPELKESETGSDPTSYIFKNVMENSLQYLNIEPDKESEKDVETIQTDQIIGEDTEDLKESLTDKGLNVSVVGSGDKVTDANIEEDSELFPNDRVILLTDERKMPDITGWSQRDVMQLAQLLDIDVDISGSGYVHKQSIEEAKEIEEDDTLEVELEAPD